MCTFQHQAMCITLCYYNYWQYKTTKTKKPDLYQTEHKTNIGVFFDERYSIPPSPPSRVRHIVRKRIDIYFFFFIYTFLFMSQSHHDTTNKGHQHKKVIIISSSTKNLSSVENDGLSTTQEQKSTITSFIFESESSIWLVGCFFFFFV